MGTNGTEITVIHVLGSLQISNAVLRTTTSARTIRAMGKGKKASWTAIRRVQLTASRCRNRVSSFKELQFGYLSCAFLNSSRPQLSIEERQRVRLRISDRGFFVTFGKMHFGAMSPRF